MRHPQRFLGIEPDAEEPLNVPRRGPALGVLCVTAVCAAVALGWSLNIAPGNRFFYPATLLVAVIYGVGSTLSSRLTKTRIPWAPPPRTARTAVTVGLALAVVFCAGAFLVQYVPFLQHPVARLLDHARVGNLWLVALTTLVNGVAEEVFYRGAVWALLPLRSRIWLSTIIYTAVTAAAGIPLLALAAAALGFVAAVLRQRDRSLVGSVLVHLVWSMTMLFVLPHIVR